jgi:hypothetical protein
VLLKRWQITYGHFNVAEDARSSRKRFVTIGWIDHQSLASGLGRRRLFMKGQKLGYIRVYRLRADEMTLWPKMALFNQYPLRRQGPELVAGEGFEPSTFRL